MISVAMATYNGEKFLREQLDSIFNQTYKNIEVIVCDDCSTDNTVSILEDYRIKKGLQYTINEKNIGFVRNFEKAIALCTGDYIALSDQDDIWLPNKIEILFSEIDSNSLIFSDSKLIDKNSNIIANSFVKYSLININTDKPLPTLFYGNFVQGATCMFKRELLNEIIPFPETIIFHDWWIALIAAASDGIKYLDTGLNKYRLHDANTTKTNWNSNILILFFNKIIKRSTQKAFYKKNIIQLHRLKEIELFHNNIHEIEECILYLEDLSNTTIHFTAMKIAYKNRKILYPDINPYYRIIFILKDLIL